MENRNYQEIVGEIFGLYFKHCTLRTLFDDLSSEWNYTSIDEKRKILKTILDSKKISFQELINGYKHFYAKELSNKDYVIDRIDKTIELYNDMTIKTIENIKPTDRDLENLNFNYQPELTKKLDNFYDNFTQETINEIVLWKVNRYSFLNEETLNLINNIELNENLNVELTSKILDEMLDKNQKGIRLAMASTILRFRNPKVYQIIDQRVFRFIYGFEMKVNENDIKSQIDLYLQYLNDLKQICIEKDIPFHLSDRILYEMDKRENKDFKIKY